MRVKKERIDFTLMKLYKSSLKDDIERKYYVAALISKEVKNIFSTNTDKEGNEKYSKYLITANEERNRSKEGYTCLDEISRSSPTLL